MVGSFAIGLNLYTQIYSREKEDVLVLIVMNMKEWNSFDIYQMEDVFFSKHGYRTQRCSLLDVSEYGEI